MTNKYIVYCQICKLKFKYDDPNIMIGRHFCSLYVYKAGNIIRIYLEIRALVMNHPPPRLVNVVFSEDISGRGF